MPKSERKRLEKLAKKRKKRKQIAKVKLLADRKERANNKSRMPAPIINDYLDESFGIEEGDEEISMQTAHTDLMLYTKEIMGDRVRLILPKEENLEQQQAPLSDKLWELTLQGIGRMPDDLFSAEKIITLYSLAWNIASVLPYIEAEHIFEHQLLKSMAQDEDWKDWFMSVLYSKRDQHPDDNRIIVKFDLLQTQKGYHLQVSWRDIEVE